jgi:hypothetical protein
VAGKSSLAAAQVTRHRANTVDRVPLEPQHGSEIRHILQPPMA